jgi:tetratricopeptide (TPR) repeat protein
VDPSKDTLVAAAGETAAILAQGDPQKTQRSFQTLLHDYPESPYLHYAYGLALASAGQNTEALAQQREELRVAPENELAQIEISRLDPNSRHSTEEVRRANALPKKPAPRDPRMIERYGHHATPPTVANGSPTPPDAWNLAMTAYEEKRYAEAISALKAVVQHQPDFGSAWAMMGLSEFELKDYKSSLLHLERGNELGSTESVQLAKYRLAILLNQSGAFGKARDLLAPEASTKSRAEEVVFAQGMSLLRIPLLPEDVESSRRALVQSAGEVALLLLESKYDAALPKFQTLITEYPAVPFLHHAYGTALASLSQYDEAEIEFRREQAISPKSELPHLRRAAIQLRLDHAAEALPSAKRAVELAPDSAEAHYLLGRTYLELGQADAALGELETASKMTPGSPEVHFNLAKAYAKAKRPDKEAEERAIFARLNALAEQKRGEHGDQSYDGPRDSNSLQVHP